MPSWSIVLAALATVGLQSIPARETSQPVRAAPASRGGRRRDGYLPMSWPDSSRYVHQGDITLAATDNVDDVTLAIERGGVVGDGRLGLAVGPPIDIR